MSDATAPTPAPAAERLCLACGCTASKACRGGCSWMPGVPGLCTACVRKLPGLAIIEVVWGIEAAHEAHRFILALQQRRQQAAALAKADSRRGKKINDLLRGAGGAG